MSSCHRWKDEVFLLLLFVLTLKTFISSKSEVYATSVPSSVAAPPNNGSWVLIFEVSRRFELLAWTTWSVSNSLWNYQLGWLHGFGSKLFCLEYSELHDPWQHRTRDLHVWPRYPMNIHFPNTNLSLKSSFLNVVSHSLPWEWNIPRVENRSWKRYILVRTSPFSLLLRFSFHPSPLRNGVNYHYVSGEVTTKEKFYHTYGK